MKKFTVLITLSLIDDYFSTPDELKSSFMDFCNEEILCTRQERALIEVTEIPQPINIVDFFEEKSKEHG